MKRLNFVNLTIQINKYDVGFSRYAFKIAVSSLDQKLQAFWFSSILLYFRSLFSLWIPVGILRHLVVEMTSRAENFEPAVQNANFLHCYLTYYFIFLHVYAIKIRAF